MIRNFIFLALLVITFSGCSDPNRVMDENKEIKNHNWGYGNKQKFEVNIDNEKQRYTIFLNLRITPQYKYSNIFILLKYGNKTTRHEFKLANPDGEWLGSGSGNLYSYRFPLLNNHLFPKKGKYYFEIEQNMRDNPLREVSDVGLRIESEQ